MFPPCICLPTTEVFLPGVLSALHNLQDIPFEFPSTISTFSGPPQHLASPSSHLAKTPSRLAVSLLHCAEPALHLAKSPSHLATPQLHLAPPPPNMASRDVVVRVSRREMIHSQPIDYCFIVGGPVVLATDTGPAAESVSWAQKRRHRRS